MNVGSKAVYSGAMMGQAAGSIDWLRNPRSFGGVVYLLPARGGGGVFRCHIEQCVQSPPNILIILADDLGYAHIACNNPSDGRIAMSHLDRLASKGMRFSDASTVCGSPPGTSSRFLSGMNNSLGGLQGAVDGAFYKESN